MVKGGEDSPSGVMENGDVGDEVINPVTGFVAQK